MREFNVERLLHTPTVTVDDVQWVGDTAQRSEPRQAVATHLAFPYRGAYVRHLNRHEAVADASQVLFFNAGESYQLSHPVAGGDASLVVVVDDAMLREITPASLLRAGDALMFAEPRLRIDPRAQVLVALLRHSLHEGIAEALEAESLTLTLVQRSLGARTTHAAGSSAGRQRLVDRAKLVLSSDLRRRWSLAEVAAEVGVSPVYLTQSFQQVEGVPLYRYQLRLRLARALDLLGDCDDLSALALELGFSSHSHFSAAFQQMYRRSPSEFRQSALYR
jgi:AraC family transcriptional regulator